MSEQCLWDIRQTSSQSVWKRRREPDRYFSTPVALWFTPDGPQPEARGPPAPPTLPHPSVLPGPQVFRMETIHEAHPPSLGPYLVPRTDGFLPHHFRLYVRQQSLFHVFYLKPPSAPGRGGRTGEGNETPPPAQGSETCQDLPRTREARDEARDEAQDSPPLGHRKSLPGHLTPPRPRHPALTSPISTDVSVFWSRPLLSHEAVKE